MNIVKWFCNWNLSFICMPLSEWEFDFQLHRIYLQKFYIFTQSLKICPLDILVRYQLKSRSLVKMICMVQVCKWEQISGTVTNIWKEKQEISKKVSKWYGKSRHLSKFSSTTGRFFKFSNVIRIREQIYTLI